MSENAIGSGHGGTALAPSDLTMESLVARFDMQPHPEGGYYRETYRSSFMLPAAALPADYGGDRAAATSILFLLPNGVCSRWHRVRSDELWIYQLGDPVALRQRTDEQARTKQTLVGFGAEQSPQVLVPAGIWQEAESVRGPAGYSLVACVVAPGFDFADFEMA